MSRSESLAKRFEENVFPVPESGCWIWVGSEKETRGELRGRVMLNGTRQYAHRWAYQIYKGDPGSLNVNHKCDVSICVNPDHLYVGTQKQNAQDASNRKRFKNRKGERNNRAKLSADDVIAIRESSESHAALSRKYGVSATQIMFVRQRKSWAHIV